MGRGVLKGEVVSYSILQEIVRRLNYERAMECVCALSVVLCVATGRYCTPLEALKQKRKRDAKSTEENMCDWSGIVQRTSVPKVPPIAEDHKQEGQTLFVVQEL